MGMICSTVGCSTTKQVLWRLSPTLTVRTPSGSEAEEAEAGRARETAATATEEAVDEEAAADAAGGMLKKSL